MGKLLVIKDADFSSVSVEKVTPVDKIHIKVLASPMNGGTVTGSGGYIEGDTVTITATPSDGYRFYQWSNGNINSSQTITVGSSSATYTAQFIENGPAVLTEVAGWFSRGNYSLGDSTKYSIVYVEIPEWTTSVKFTRGTHGSNVSITTTMPPATPLSGSINQISNISDLVSDGVTYNSTEDFLNITTGIVNLTLCAETPKCIICSKKYTREDVVEDWGPASVIFT